jgi:integrase
VAPNPKALACPECGSTSLHRDGLRYLKDGSSVQRWLCKACGYRFTQRKALQENLSGSINTASNILSNCQGSHEALSGAPSATKAVQTLATVENPIKTGLAGATQQTADAKGKIVEHSFWLLKQGYAESTIKGRAKLLRILAKRGANLFDPESVKETIAKQKWSAGRKVNAVDAYTCFLQMIGKSWEPPHYKRVRKLPFIPTENEVDQLIAGCGRKTATLLQLLKETGMRIGEAWKLHWTEIDFVSNIIRVTPEKGSNPRVFKVSNKLMSMLKALQEHSSSNRVFQKSLRSQARLFHKQRRKIALKLQNPRILSISFHTFRHWKATMEYHKTKDILHVMKVLGHKNINNTLVYTQLVDFGDDEYTVRVAHTIEEDKQLIEAGFEYVTERDGYKIYRKRK